MIVITGHSGFLGKEIKKAFDSKSYCTLGRSNSDIICDLILDIPKIIDCETIIHSAGMAHFVPVNDADKQKFIDTNVIGTENLLKGLEIFGIPRKFVFISSVSVYGLNYGIEIDEESELNSSDPYGKSKIEAETLIINWCIKYNVKFTILRLPLVIGSKPPGNLGSMIKAIRSGYYFNISNGNAKKSMVLASDVSKSILSAAEIGGIYNLTDGYHPSFYELSNLIARQFGRKFVPNMPFYLAKSLAITGDILGSNIPINSDKLKKITSTLTFNDLKARNAFGWNPTPVLKGFYLHE